jgi:hypothetical protein
MPKHLNIYGPQASGKTRNADAFAKLFGCRKIVEADDFHRDQGRLSAALDGSAKTLFLSIEPVCAPGDHRVRAMKIGHALKVLNNGRVPQEPDNE